MIRIKIIRRQEIVLDSDGNPSFDDRGNKLYNEIYVGEELDLYKDTAFEITYQALAIADLANRRSSYTSSFTIPRTAKNKRILGMLGMQGNSSKIPFQKVEVEVLLGHGTEIIPGGSLLVSETTEKEYRVNIYYGMLTLADLLGDKRLVDINTSSFNHTFSKAVFIDSISPLGRSGADPRSTIPTNPGFIYAIADFGSSIQDGVINCEYQLPSYYVNAIFNLLTCEQSNLLTDSNCTIEWGSDPLPDSLDWKSLVLTSTVGINPEGLGQQIDDLGDILVNGGTPLTEITSFDWFTQNFYVKGAVEGDGANALDPDLSLSSETSPEFNVITSNFGAATPESKARLQIGYKWTGVINWGTNIDLIVDKYDTVSDTYIQQDIRRFTVVPKPVYGTVPPFVGEIIGYEDQTYYANYLFNVEGDDKFRFRYVISSEYRKDGDYVVKVDPSPAIKIDFFKDTSTTEVFFKDYIDNDLTQIDFLKELMYRFGIVGQRYKDTNRFDFRTMDWILSGNEGYVDWTEKIISITKEIYNNEYAQNNVFTYDYPKETNSRNEDEELSLISAQWDGNLVVNNDNAELKKTFNEPLYEAPRELYKVNGIPIYSIPVYSFDDNGEVEVEDSPVKMMSAYQPEEDQTWSIDFNSQGATSKTGRFYVLSDIAATYLWTVGNKEQNFNNSLYGKYYHKIQKMLNDYRELEIEVNLNLFDLANLDFFKLVFLKQTGRYYLLNNVKYKTNGQATAVLIQVS